MTAAVKHKHPTAIVTPRGDRELHIERIFDAPRERVWDAMTKPELLSQWWGRGNKLVVETFELRKGGHWRFVEHAGGAEHGFEGRFAEIQAPERLEQTFEWDGAPGRVVYQTMVLEVLPDGRTKLVGDSLFMTAALREGMVKSGMEAGMNQSYAVLDALLARG